MYAVSLISKMLVALLEVHGAGPAVVLACCYCRAGATHAATPSLLPAPQVHPIPLSDVRAISKHTPPLGQHRVTITLASGVSLPSLHFQTVSPAVLRLWPVGVDARDRIVLCPAGAGLLPQRAFAGQTVGR